MSSPSSLGEPVVRLEGRDKVTGAARYAAEYTPPGCLYAWPVPATVVKGTITAIDSEEALAHPGVLAVLTHENAPLLGDAGDATLAVLQSPEVAHRGQIVALAVAETLEAARAAAAAVRISYQEQPHDVLLTLGHPGLYRPDEVNGGLPADRERGDFDAAFAEGRFQVDATYRIPPLHNHPMEPHASTAWWESGHLTVHDSNQGATGVQRSLATLFGVRPARVTVASEHVGGGFGCKGTARPNVVLAAMAAGVLRQPVKLAMPRAQLAATVGHRPPTIQRLRLAADADGRITALSHEAVTCTSTVKEFVEQSATPARSLYVSPNSRTTHRVVRLDVPTPSWMRAPGECPGMFALESAMDELAEACGTDPVELRLRNDTATDPDTGRPFSSRHLAECLREGARLFGWEGRDPRPGVRREGRFLTGTGVAVSTYPFHAVRCLAEARTEPSGGYRIQVNATDIGTGARTVLAQIAADVLEAPLGDIAVEVGSSDLPAASVAGGSSGTASWGWAVHKACHSLRRRISEYDGVIPDSGLAVEVDTGDDIAEMSDRYARRAFGAQFAEVRVDTDTGETRATRLLGVFAAGRILNPRTARSQFVGGMTMGLSMALMEYSGMDAVYGDHVERDLASYHVATCADVPDIETHWIDESDPHLGPLGSKGIGEIGIVGGAAAVTNAVHHATGVRIRTLPAHPETLLAAMAERDAGPRR